MSKPLSIGTPTVQAAKAEYRVVGGLDQSGANPTERPLSVNASGAINVVVVPGPVGGNIVTQADVVLPAIGTVTALGAVPANSRTITVQNTVTGSLCRVREVGGAVGSGVLLAYLQSITFSEAVEALEGEAIGGVASAVAVIYETN